MPDPFVVIRCDDGELMRFHHSNLRHAPEPSATAGEGKWREVGRNENAIMWRRADTGAVCFGSLKTSIPGDSETGYSDDERRAHLGQYGYMKGDGGTCHGYVPVVEPPKPAEQAKPDPYVLARKELALKIDSENPEADVGLATRGKPGQKEAREKLVAALAAEQQQSKPFAPRFPPESRSDRVYAVNREDGGRR